MKKELVSIIVPVYNGEKYIEKCIESINKQTYKEIEIIVINDGSTDKTKEILEEISMKQKNMTILNKKENKGTAICKNIGIQHSKGKYIFFVDSDDTITEDAINKMLNLLKKNNGDAIRTTYRFDYNGKIVKGNEKIENIAFAQNRKVELIQKFLLDQIHGFCSGVFLLKKDIIIKNNIRFKEDMTIMEDFIFLLEIIKNSNVIVTSDLVTLYYYQNNAGLTKSYQDIEKRWYNIKVRLDYTIKIIQKYKSLEKYQEDSIRYLVSMYIKSTKYIFLKKVDIQEERQNVKNLKKNVNDLINGYQIDTNKFNLICKIIYYFLNKEKTKSLHIMFGVLDKVERIRNR
ncbi:MAG: glycosyltransferase family 2 protein [Clostridia bacterium]|nr:glycosyltransferase family 2 protein [Clostridia bacterium]